MYKLKVLFFVHFRFKKQHLILPKMDTASAEFRNFVKCQQKIESKKNFGERCLSMSSPIMEQRMIADTHDKADIM